jgi:hypothetical protein
MPQPWRPCLQIRSPVIIRLAGWLAGWLLESLPSLPFVLCSGCASWRLAAGVPSRCREGYIKAGQARASIRSLALLAAQDALAPNCACPSRHGANRQADTSRHITRYVTRHSLLVHLASTCHVVLQQATLEWSAIRASLATLREVPEHPVSARKAG